MKWTGKSINLGAFWTRNSTQGVFAVLRVYCIYHSERHCGICIILKTHLPEPPTTFMHFKCIWRH